MTRADRVMTRVYLRGGRLAHVLSEDGSPNRSGCPALCGQTPARGYWMGTGTQDEYEHAAKLPTCTRCAVCAA